MTKDADITNIKKEKKRAREAKKDITGAKDVQCIREGSLETERQKIKQK